MEIAPRYDTDPIIVIDGPADDQRAPVCRQRRRLARELAALTDDEWRTPSRCADWTVQDVVNHLVAVDGFWYASLLAGLSGSPSRMLVGFDPHTTPAALAEGMRALAPSESLAQLTAGVEALCATLEALDDAGWQSTAESPPGHVPVRVLAHHALWDAWVHERDIFLPLGRPPVEEADEVLASLRYAAALAPAFSLTTDAERRGSLVLEVSDPAARIVVDVAGAVHVHDGAPGADPVVLRGRAVDLLEALSIRAPLDQRVDPDHRWLITGLAEVFDAELRD